MCVCVCVCILIYSKYNIVNIYKMYVTQYICTIYIYTYTYLLHVLR